jgi:hypothetical protein
MATRAEIRNRYPRKIELDESLGTPGPSFLRIRPGGTPQVRPVSIRLMGVGRRRRGLQGGPAHPLAGGLR